MPAKSADYVWDIAIVGGGPAGLSAALGLARCMRKVIVCDAGNPRNGPARIFNGYLSRDDSSPSEFLEISRQQLLRYETVELRQVTVTQAERAKDCFHLNLQTGEQVTSRILLLATGIVDVLPEIEGFVEFYGTTAHSCPLCDGWEHRDQAIVVTGGTTKAAGLAVEMRLWSHDVALCCNGPLQCDQRTRTQLARTGVQVHETPILRLEGSYGKLQGVRFCDDSFLPRDALFFYPEQHQHSPLGIQLGCSIDPGEGCISCDTSGRTGVPGLYAAGNASRGVQMVIAAAAEGMAAALTINNDLLEADSSAAEL